MKHLAILAVILTLSFSNSYGQHEASSRTTPCKPLTIERQLTTFEGVQASLSDNREFDTTYVFIKDRNLANLEKLADWATENEYLIRWHKNIEYGEGLSNILDIGFYKSDLRFEDFTTFIEAIKSGQRYLKLDECIHGTTLKTRPIEK